MTVYVDDFRTPRRVGRIRGNWSHLVSDASDAELHAFAREIGLNRAWFQYPEDPIQLRRHYDVVEAKRRAAIAAGATPISFRELGRMIAAARNQADGGATANNE